MEEPIISGIAFNRDEAKITVLGVPDTPGIAYQILGPIADANIDVDMIIQNTSADGATDFTFTVHKNEMSQSHWQYCATKFKAILKRAKLLATTKSLKWLCGGCGYALTRRYCEPNVPHTGRRRY